MSGFLRGLFRKREALPIQQSAGAGFADLFRPGGVSTLSTRTVVLIGNCIAEGVQVGLSSARTASSPRFVCLPLHLRPMNSPESLREIASADHVFAQQLGAMDWDLLRKTMKPGAVEVQLPDLVFRSPWPFDGESGFSDPAVALKPNARIRHQDGTLGRLRSIEPNKAKRLRLYCNLDFEWAGMIDRVIETQNRFLLRLDEVTETGIGKFILDSNVSTQLFYNSTHPSAIVFEFLCKYVWDALSLATPTPTFTGIDSWREWSVPIHPLVARKLGLLWAEENTRYQYGMLGNPTWKEWVEAYIEEFG